MMRYIRTSHYHKGILIFSFISIMTALIAFIKVSQGHFSAFDPELFLFGVPFGAFIWGDLLVFSLVWFVLCLMLLRTEDSRYFWVAFCSFWLIRGVGETLYWFVQQFNPQHQPWANYYPHIFFLGYLKPEEIWVFHQITWQAVTIASLVGLIYNTILLIREKS